MGAWGTAISSNDTFADTYGSFFDLYNDGLDVKQISKILIDRNKQTIEDSEDSNNFWFALAKAQWECKQLNSELFERVKQIIESGADLNVWRELDAEPKDIVKRKIALDKFLADIQTEKPKAKSRKKKVIKQPVFEKGDCLTFKLANGNYGGAVVLEAIKDTVYGHNLIATTRINQPNKPTKKEFENADVLFVNYANWDDKPSVNWYNPIRHKQSENLIERIGTIEVQFQYDSREYSYGFVSDFKLWFIGVADQQFESEKTNPRSKIKQTIRELTRSKKWKF